MSRLDRFFYSSYLNIPTIWQDLSSNAAPILLLPIVMEIVAFTNISVGIFIALDAGELRNPVRVFAKFRPSMKRDVYHVLFVVSSSCLVQQLMNPAFKNCLM